MEVRLDLHIHSQASPDGRMSLREIVEAAKRAGLQGVAVCDHDRVLAEAPEFPDFLLIPGTEVSTDRGHLLGLFVRSPVAEKTLPEAAEAIRAQGGIAVLAHPFEHRREAAELDPVAPCLDGAEVWNSRAERKNRRANVMAAAFAESHGLRPFGGSDAHLPREIGHGVTCVEVPELTPEAVKAALLAGTARVSGCRSRAIDTARSQLTRRRKQKAGLLSYGKWVLFAGKCLLRDLRP